MRPYARSVFAALLLAGCVTVYQPLTGLQRPVVVNTDVANFTGLKLKVNCVPSEFLDATGAQILCRKLSTLFSNQGATVETTTQLGVPPVGDDADETTPDAPSDLTLELNARLIHIEKNTILWIVSFASFTLFPAVTEYTFAQDVTIRDARGFLLAQDSLQGRFVRYFGVSTWAANWLLDKTVREDSEKLTGGATERDFSRDFYGQLSQLVLNAHTRWRVLHAAAEAAN